jgi:hypothetical protein
VDIGVVGLSMGYGVLWRILISAVSLILRLGHIPYSKKSHCETDQSRLSGNLFEGKDMNSTFYWSRYLTEKFSRM